MNQPIDLVGRIKKGDEKAFEEAFRKLYAPLCAHANKYLRDVDQAEEIVQDVFYNFWSKRKQLEVRGVMDAYLFRSVRNACYNYIKHQNVKQEYVLHKVSDLKEEENIHYDPLIELELQQKIHECIDQLPPERQKIYRLSREEGLKYKEIAEQLGISIKTVEAQMGKALQSLRENLSAYLSLILLITLNIIYWLNDNF